MIFSTEISDFRSLLELVSSVEVIHGLPHILHDTTIVLLEFQTHERDNDTITEVGMSTLRVTHIVGMDPGDRGMDWMPKVETKHFRTIRNLGKQNRLLTHDDAKVSLSGITKSTKWGKIKDAIYEHLRSLCSDDFPGVNDLLAVGGILNIIAFPRVPRKPYHHTRPETEGLPSDHNKKECESPLVLSDKLRQPTPDPAPPRPPPNSPSKYNGLEAKSLQSSGSRTDGGVAVPPMVLLRPRGAPPAQPPPDEDERCEALDFQSAQSCAGYINDDKAPDIALCPKVPTRPRPRPKPQPQPPHTEVSSQPVQRTFELDEVVNAAHLGYTHVNQDMHGHNTAIFSPGMLLARPRGAPPAQPSPDEDDRRGTWYFGPAQSRAQYKDGCEPVVMSGPMTLAKPAGKPAPQPPYPPPPPSRRENLDFKHMLGKIREATTFSAGVSEFVRRVGRAIPGQGCGMRVHGSGYGMGRMISLLA